MKRFWQTCTLGLLILLPLSSQASRQITDQIGRQVTIPDHVDRIVVLQHQTLNLLVQMNATDKIVGVMANWKQQLGDGYARLAPELNHMATLGDLTHVDPEKLVTLHPQVVFVTNYAPHEMIDSIRGLRLSGTKTHVKQRFLPLKPLLMVSDVLWSPVLPA